MTIHRAGPADISRIAPLFDAYRNFYGCVSDLGAATSFLRARLERNESIIFFAEAGESVAGFTQLYPTFSSIRLSPSIVLNDLFVAPEFRRLGIAEGLMQAAVRFAGEAGASGVSLKTQKGNTAARELYASRGWREDEEFVTYTIRTGPPAW